MRKLQNIFKKWRPPRILRRGRFQNDEKEPDSPLGAKDNSHVVVPHDCEIDIPVSSIHEKKDSSDESYNFENDSLNGGLSFSNIDDEATMLASDLFSVVSSDPLYMEERVEKYEPRASIYHQEDQFPVSVDMFDEADPKSIIMTNSEEPVPIDNICGLNSVTESERQCQKSLSTETFDSTCPSFVAISPEGSSADSYSGFSKESSSSKESSGSDDRQFSSRSFLPNFYHNMIARRLNRKYSNYSIVEEIPDDKNPLSLSVTVDDNGEDDCNSEVSKDYTVDCPSSYISHTDYQDMISSADSVYSQSTSQSNSSYSTSYSVDILDLKARKRDLEERVKLIRSKLEEGRSHSY